jgi:hypothetical protein
LLLAADQSTDIMVHADTAACVLQTDSGGELMMTVYNFF